MAPARRLGGAGLATRINAAAGPLLDGIVNCPADSSGAIALSFSTETRTAPSAGTDAMIDLVLVALDGCLTISSAEAPTAADQDVGLLPALEALTPARAQR